MLRPTGILHQDAMERFTVCRNIFFQADTLTHALQALTRDLEAVVVQVPAQSLSVLPPTHDIRVLFQRILSLADDAADRERTPLMISQKIVQMLYKTNSQLGREIYVAILDQLCHAFDEVAKEAITWLLYAEDEVSLFHFIYTRIATQNWSSASTTFLSPSRSSAVACSTSNSMTSFCRSPSSPNPVLPLSRMPLVSFERR